MWWRINHYLKYQNLPIGDGETLDLQADSMIRTLDLGATDWIDVGDIQGLKFTLDCHHAWAPYPEKLPPTLLQTKVTVTADAGAGNVVKLDIPT